MPKMLLSGLAQGLIIDFPMLAVTLPAEGRLEPLHVWANLAWQLVEQTAGGLLDGLGLFFHRVNANMEREGAL